MEPLTVQKTKEVINGEEPSDTLQKKNVESECSSIPIYPVIFVYVLFILMLYANRNGEIMEDLRRRRDTNEPNGILLCIVLPFCGYLLYRSDKNIIENDAK